MRKFTLRTPREPKDCEQCGTALPLVRHHKAYLCEECKSKAPYRRTGWQAHRLVACAIRLGFLPRPATCKCVDCGVQATEYDHRDYGKPLEVEPVCRTCNFARGPAKQAPIA